MKLSWKRITAHTRYTFRIARPGSSVKANGTEIERIVVSIERDGIVGRGEATPTPYYNQSLESVERALANASPLLGNDPGDVDRIVDRLLDAFDDQRAAVSAIDVAVHDWLGRSRGLPVWRLLGLDVSRTPPTSMTIGIDRLDLLPEKVARAADFVALKIKVGSGDDVKTLGALRRLAPDKRVRVDANCGWPAESIIEHVRPLMIGFARERDMRVMLGCMVETSLGVSAAAHIASLADYADLDGHLLLADDPFTGLALHDGVVLPGDEPGLGVVPRAASW